MYTYLLRANSANTTHEQGQRAELVGLEEPEVPKTTVEMVLTCILRLCPTARKAANLFKGLILTCEYIFTWNKNKMNITHNAGTFLKQMMNKDRILEHFIICKMRRHK